MMTKGHINDSLLDKLPSCGQLDVTIRNYFVRELDLLKDLKTSDLRSVEIFQKLKDHAEERREHQSLFAAMIHSTIVLGSWRGHEWYCLSALAWRLRLPARIAKRLDMDLPYNNGVMGSSSPMTLAGSPKSQYSNSPMKRSRRSSLLRGDDKEKVILTMATSILASLADSELDLGPVVSLLVPKEEVSFGVKGKSLTFSGPDTILPLLWMVVMSWKQREEIVDILKLDFKKAFDLSRHVSSSREETFVRARIGTLPLYTFDCELHEPEIKAIELILKLTSMALKTAPTLTSLHILGVSDVNVESINELINSIVVNILISPLLVELIENRDKGRASPTFIESFVPRACIGMRVLGSIVKLESELLNLSSLNALFSFLADSLRFLAVLIFNNSSGNATHSALFAQYAHAVVTLMLWVKDDSELYQKVLASITKSVEVVILNSSDEVFQPVISILIDLAEASFISHIPASVSGKKKRGGGASQRTSVHSTTSTALDTPSITPVMFDIIGLSFRTQLHLTDQCKFACLLGTKAIILDMKSMHDLEVFISAVRAFKVISKSQDTLILAVCKAFNAGVVVAVNTLLERYEHSRMYTLEDKQKIGRMTLSLSKYLAMYAADLLLSEPFQRLINAILLKVIAPLDHKHPYLLIGLMHLGINTPSHGARRVLFSTAYKAYLQLICIKHHATEPVKLQTATSHTTVFERYMRLLAKYVGIAPLDEDESLKSIKNYLRGLFDLDERVIHALHLIGNAQAQLTELLQHEGQFLREIHERSALMYREMLPTPLKSQFLKTMSSYEMFNSLASNNPLFEMSYEALKPATFTKPPNPFNVLNPDMPAFLLSCLEDRQLWSMLHTDDLFHTMLVRASLDDYFESAVSHETFKKATEEEEVFQHTLLYMSSVSNLLSLASIESCVTLLGRCTLLDTLKHAARFNDVSLNKLFGFSHGAAIAVHRFIVKLHHSYLSILQPIPETKTSSTTKHVLSPSSPRRLSHTGLTMKPPKQKLAELGSLTNFHNESLYTSALDGMSQLSACGQWTGCCKIVDTMLNFYEKVPQLEGQPIDENQRIRSIRKELKLSRDKYSERLAADIMLIPMPIHYATRFTSPPHGGNSDFWVIYKFDPTSFSSHFYNLSGEGMPPAFYSEFVRYLQKTYPDFVVYPPTVFLPSSETAKAIQVFQAHPIFNPEAEEGAMPSSFHVYTCASDVTIFAESETLESFGIASGLPVPATFRFTLSLTSPEAEGTKEEGKEEGMEEEDDDDDEDHMTIGVEDIAKLRGLVTWCSPVSMANVDGCDAIHRDQSLVEVLRLQKETLESLKSMLDEILLHKPSSLVVDGGDNRLVCVKSVFTNVITHMANMLVGDSTGREFCIGSQCVGLHNAEMLIGGEEERRNSHWQEIRKREKRKQIKEAEEAKAKAVSGTLSVRASVVGGVDSTSKSKQIFENSHTTMAMEDNNGLHQHLQERQLDLAVVEESFNEETAAILEGINVDKDACDLLCNYIIDRLWEICNTFFPIVEETSSVPKKVGGAGIGAEGVQGEGRDDELDGDDDDDDDSGIESPVVDPMGDARSVRELVTWVDGAYSTMLTGSSW